MFAQVLCLSVLIFTMLNKNCHHLLYSRGNLVRRNIPCWLNEARGKPSHTCLIYTLNAITSFPGRHQLCFDSRSEHTPESSSNDPTFPIAPFTITINCWLAHQILSYCLLWPGNCYRCLCSFPFLGTHSAIHPTGSSPWTGLHSGLPRLLQLWSTQ